MARGQVPIFLLVASDVSTLMSHEVPERAWENVGFNLYSYHGKDYLIIVSYMCNFFNYKSDCLTDTKSRTGIKKLKAPDTESSDRSPPLWPKVCVQ